MGLETVSQKVLRTKTLSEAQHAPHVLS